MHGEVVHRAAAGGGQSSGAARHRERGRPHRHGRLGSLPRSRPTQWHEGAAPMRTCRRRGHAREAVSVPQEGSRRHCGSARKAARCPRRRLHVGHPCQELTAGRRSARPGAERRLGCSRQGHAGHLSGRPPRSKERSWRRRGARAHTSAHKSGRAPRRGSCSRSGSGSSAVIITPSMRSAGVPVAEGGAAVHCRDPADPRVTQRAGERASGGGHALSRSPMGWSHGRDVAPPFRESGLVRGYEQTGLRARPRAGRAPRPTDHRETGQTERLRITDVRDPEVHGVVRGAARIGRGHPGRHLATPGAVAGQPRSGVEGESRTAVAASSEAARSPRPRAGRTPGLGRRKDRREEAWSGEGYHQVHPASGLRAYGAATCSP
jgi:hypothetical protein